jgi:hypothetical protein
MLKTQEAVMSPELSAITSPALEDEIATLAAHLNAASHRLLCLIAEYDRREAWADAGARSCADWLAWRIGLDPGAAREHVRVARALPDVPRLAAAFGRGELSYSKVRALTRIARPDIETDLLAMARAGTAAHVERLVRAYRRADPQAERDRTHGQQENRWLRTYWADDGSLRVEGRLTSEQGALLEKALAAAVQEQYQGDTRSVDPTFPQRQADALALVADRALGGGQTRTGGDRVQVVVHVDAEVLADPAADGRSELEDGPRVSAETTRRLACDCSTVELQQDPAGELRPGRKTRVISAPLRRAIRARDGGRCAFPGCSCRITDAHHIRHWADGGATTLENCWSLCPRHHTLVHEGGWRVELAHGQAVFRRPDGTVHPAVPAAPRLGPQPVADLCRAQAALGITVETGLPTWDGSPADYDLAVTGLWPRAA